MNVSQPRYIRIFLSSPGDVADERGLALRVIDQLPYDPLLRGKVTLEAVAWDRIGTDVPMLVTMTPQEAINLGLPKPSECDIVIVLFWSRMGTPLSVEKHGTKSDGTPYLSGTEWEYLDAVASARTSGMPLTLVYRRTEKLALDPDDSLFDQKTEQYRRVKAFFEAFTASDGAILQSHHPYSTPDDFQQKFENHLRELLRRLLEAPQKPAQIVQTKQPELWPGSPFPGLRAFGPNDAPIFFGRGRETGELVKRVKESRFVAVVGASGSGKSSLVGAGLIPRLRDNAISGDNLGSKDWHLVSFKPGEANGQPFESLYNALLRTFPALCPNPLEASEVKRKFLAEIQQNPAALADTCRATLAGSPAWSEVLLFIDQFEELFTVVTDIAVRRAFVAMLVHNATAERLRTVVTLRADFYRRCVELDDLAVLLRDGSFPLAAPRQRALYEMISRPADKAGLEFDEGLAEWILDDTGDDPGALALMAYLLDELYKVCQRNHSGILTKTAYKVLGGVQSAIGAKAQNVFEALDAEAQAALPIVFRELVSVDEHGTATRQRTVLARFEDKPGALRLIDELTKEHLLVQSQGDEHRPVVEVAHEALFRNWERLRTWIEDTQADLFQLRQVRQAVDLWERSERHDDFRWTGQRLKEAQAMVSRLQPELNATEGEFLRSEVERLEKRLEDPALDHLVRAKIGEQLHVIRDTRRGVGLRDDGLPDIAWCPVSGGTVTLEANAGTFEVQPFYIAKYPITYLQFQAFLDDLEGYQNDRWWKNLKKEVPGEQYLKFSNCPRENVSWYDAMAFCRWLTAKLPVAAWPVSLPQPLQHQGLAGHLRDPREPSTDRWGIRLPTEWEWQQAATGGNPTNEYPWGSAWDLSKANTGESGLSRTTAVGMYPQGAAACGALDMSGNVWEWCLNDYEKPTILDANLNSMGRACRGGSWGNYRGGVRAAARSYFSPSSRVNGVGLRVECGVTSP